jgi:hypothetical protein
VLIVDLMRRVKIQVWSWWRKRQEAEPCPLQNPAVACGMSNTVNLACSVQH